MKNLRDYVITMIGTILFFGTLLLFDYLVDKSVDWKWIIISTILFAIFEGFCQSQRSKKMKLVDYTGKLNNHNEYLKIIKQLENKCKYIEYVLVNEDEKEFIEQFESFIISEKLKNKWWGTKSSGKSKIYKLKASKEIFKYLSQFETFSKYISSEKGDIIENTNFGINDIAFFDDKEIPLLFTTTHEGYITIREDLVIEHK